MQNTKTFDFGNMTKDGAIQIAQQLGVKRDWARVTKPELLAMLRAFNTEQLLGAAQRACEAEGEEFTADDWLVDADEVSLAVDEAGNVTADTNADWDDDEAEQAETEPEPEVTEVAAMLAKLMAKGKGKGKATVSEDDVRKIVAPMLEEMSVEICNRLGAATGEAIKQAMADGPVRHIVVKSDRVEVKIDGLQHKHFEDLLQVCAARTADGHRLNVYLYGPAGTGKTTAARNIAKALGLPFHCNGSLGTKYELTGFIDANGVCHDTEFRKAWKDGGVYLFDEIDGSVSQAILAFNAALANGVMSFPDGMIERHPDCVVIAAGNTVHGANAQFTGRTKLDEASLDRFVFLEWEIDEALEAAMCGNSEWAREVQAFRKKVAAKGIKVAITPRASMYGASLLANGMRRERVRELVLRKGMTAEQWAMVA